MSDSVSGVAARGVIWLGSSTLVISILRLAVIGVLARLLTPDDFGVVAAALIATGFIGSVANHGLMQAVVQRPELEDRHRDTALIMAVLAGVLSAVIIVLLAPAAESVFAIDGVAPVMVALALMPAIDGLGLTSNAMLRRNLEFAFLARAQVIAYVVGYAVVGVTAALADLGVWALVWAAIGQTAVGTLLMIWKAPPGLPRRVTTESARELLPVSFGFTLGALGFFVAQRVDDFGVGRWLGAAALGLYTRAYRLMADPGDRFGQVIADVLFPAMAKVQTQTARLRSIAMAGVGTIAILTIPASLVLSLLAEEVIAVFLGDQWGGAVGPFRILAFGMVFRTSFKMSEAVAKATGAVYRRAWRQWAYALLVLLAVAIGRAWELNGVALGVTLAMGANFLLMAWLSLSLLDGTWRDFFRAHFPAIRLSLLTVPIGWVVAEGVRELGANPLVVLGISGGVAGLVGLAAVISYPRLFSVDQLPAVIANFRSSRVKAERAKG